MNGVNLEIDAIRRMFFTGRELCSRAPKGE